MSAAALVALLGGVRATIFALAAVVLLIVAGAQTWRLHTSQVALATAQKQTAIAETTAQWNLGTIKELREANAEFAETCRADAARDAETIAGLQSRTNELDAQARTLRARLAEVYRHDQASRDWAAVRVPDAVVVRLRE